MKKQYILEFDMVTKELPYSEACMASNVAGTVQSVRIKPNLWGCDILNNHGRPTGGSITLPEAGFYQDEGGWYYWMTEGSDWSVNPDDGVSKLAGRGY
tara:strand:- start:186 stop:479 length:294 start_codon:yes stop_codon:yes gene_type:complete